MAEMLVLAPVVHYSPQVSKAIVLNYRIGNQTLWALMWSWLLRAWHRLKHGCQFSELKDRLICAEAKGTNLGRSQERTYAERQSSLWK